MSMRENMQIFKRIELMSLVEGDKDINLLLAWCGR